MNGPHRTFIVGQSSPDTGANGANAVRCAYLDANSLLAGFTLSNGFTATSGAWAYDRSGGGAMLDDGGTISNCVIRDCSAASGGAGILCYLGGAVVGSTITRNLSVGAIECSYGGLVRNCLITENSAYVAAGIELWYGGTIQNCTICSNVAGFFGGGIYCASNGVIQNCIMYHNIPDNHTTTVVNAKYEYCCTTPAIPVQFDGGGNITSTPEFEDEAHCDYRLTLSSPCVDAGTNMDWMNTATDIEGNPRIYAVYQYRVDMGAYEFVPEPVAILAFPVALFLTRRCLRCSMQLFV